MSADLALTPLTALSAVDGRYRHQTGALSAYFSEAALIRYRVQIEIAWLRTILPPIAPHLLTADVEKSLSEIEAMMTITEAAAVKQLETQTRHDVKAIEYWLGQRLKERQMGHLSPYIHFACTSWDINNIAFSLQMTAALRAVIVPQWRLLVEALKARAVDFADIPMLSRTHGQAASPTTVGKEFANFSARLAPRVDRLASYQLSAKLNGATGNYNAHVVAAPHIDWPPLARRFVESWGLRFSTHTTQIEPYDDLAELFDLLRRINVIVLDLCRDCWGYISLDYFLQQSAAGAETGSSTMPHKVNPIDFENAEGNLGLANSGFVHFSDKLPVSRWQRDLSDSTVLRAVGGALGHTLIAAGSVLNGLNKIRINHDRLAADLEANWQVLTEAVQTVLRAEGITDAYEQLKAFSRGKSVDAVKLRTLIEGLDITPAAKNRLLVLTPADYCGLAATLARNIPA